MKQVLPLIALLLAGCVDIATVDDEVLATAESCAVVGGIWNECSSPCLGTAKEVCAAVCIAQCECMSDVQCPLGYKCRQTAAGEPGACVNA